jgi:hypothetical protein
MILDHQQDPAAAAAAGTSSKERSTQQQVLKKEKGKTKQRRLAGDNTYMQKLKPSFVLRFSSVINKSRGKQKSNKKKTSRICTKQPPKKAVAADSYGINNNNHLKLHSIDLVSHLITISSSIIIIIIRRTLQSISINPQKQCPAFFAVADVCRCTSQQLPSRALSLSLILSLSVSLCLFPIELCVPCEKKQARTCLQAKVEGKQNKKQNKTQTKMRKLTAKETHQQQQTPTDGRTNGRTDGRIEGFVESFYIQQNNNTVSERASERASEQRKAAGPARKLGPVKKKKSSKVQNQQNKEENNRKTR